jgi:pimeloyl-ACP methyl ester carboxylesterase
VNDFSLEAVVNDVRVSVNCRESSPGFSPTVIFLHGWFDSQKTWDLVVSKINNCNAVTIDFPGFGKSEPLPTSLTTLSTYADILVQVLEQLPKPRYIVAHSMGGLILMEALQKVYSADRVVFVGTPFYGVSWLARASRLPKLPKMLPWLFKKCVRLTRWIYLPHNLAGIPLRAYGIQSANSRTVVDLCSQVANYDKLLTPLGISTLIARGENEWLLSQSDMIRASKDLDAKTFVFTGADHNPQLEHSEMLTLMLENFFELC